MSEREQHMDTDKRTGTSGQCGNTDEMRWDLGTLFPAKGDPRRPPEWLGRALLYIAIAIVLLSFCWRSWGKIEYLIIDVVISLFLALAVEPVVIPLIKHGWKRSSLSTPMFILGLIFAWQPLVYIGIGLFAASTVFALVTLPVEFDASKRAIQMLSEGGYISGAEEERNVRKVLSAAALTYVAAAVTSLLSLLRLILIAKRNDRN